VLTVSVLLGYSLQSVAGSAYYSLLTQTYTTVSSPPVILENGTVGTSTIYTNKTCAKTSVSGYGYDFVDNNDTNVDLNANKGTQSNFTAQQYGPDSITDTLTEEVVYNSTVMSFSPDYRWELNGDETDSVDAANSDGGNDPSWVANIIPYGESQCGDYNGSSDETLIPNQADINSADTYEKSIFVWVEIDTIDTSGNGRVIWGEGGASRGLALYVLDVGGEDRLYAVVYEDSGATRDYCYTTISTGTLYHIGLTLDVVVGEMTLYVDGVEAANDTSLAIGTTFGTHVGGIAIGGVDVNLKNHNNDTLNGYFDGRIADVVYYAEQTVLAEEDFASIYATGIGEKYEFDLEVQWTSVDYDETYEELCIRTGTFSGSEDLMIYAWNVSASGWNFLYNLTMNSWNNVSVTDWLNNGNFTVRFLGGTESSDASQNYWEIDATLLHIWTETDYNYDYVLRVNNTDVGSWKIRLKEYSNSSIGRLQNCTIYFHNATDGTSSQLVIENGLFINETGPWYDLGGSETIYIAMTAQANSTGTSYVHVYLEILTSGTTTYAQYVIAFEIT